MARFAVQGHFADCYTTSVSSHVDLKAFVTAFYSTRLFSVERWILKVIARRPSSQADIDALASGASDRFAAWDVEDRSATQLLLRDMSGLTRSWLMVRPDRASNTTILNFGSAVLGSQSASASKPKLSPLIRMTLPFHHWYSRALFRAAKKALERER
ncbi:MAG: hypothetical protein AAFN07_14900 [Pseudomonadota bacterium]